MISHETSAASCTQRRGEFETSEPLICAFCVVSHVRVAKCSQPADEMTDIHGGVCAVSDALRDVFHDVLNDLHQVVGVPWSDVSYADGGQCSVVNVDLGAVNDVWVVTSVEGEKMIEAAAVVGIPQDVNTHVLFDLKENGNNNLFWLNIYKSQYVNNYASV